jgi:cobalt-zinc-cadmium efflux system protein
MSGHHHHHSHGGHHADYNRMFAIGVVLNLAYVVLEAGVGLAIGSLALVADAGHNLSDVLSLSLAWSAAWLAGRAPTRQRSYGFRRATILASLLSAVLLLVTMGAIGWEALERIRTPNPVNGTIMMAVAALGVVVNTATALLFLRDRKRDLNIRGAFLHMAADAAISLGVVIAGALILLTGWLWLDPAINLLVVLAIVFATWSLLKESLVLLLDMVPAGVDAEAVEAWLRSSPGVEDLHDLHIWSVSTTDVVLTVHLVMSEATDHDLFLHKLRDQLFKRFDIGHTTIQIEHQHIAHPCQHSVCCYHR